MEWLRRLERGLRVFEHRLLAFVVFAFFGLAVLAVGLKIARHGVQWLDMLVRYLVVLVGLLGGVVATDQGRHISVDVLARALRGRAKDVAGRIVDAASAGLCAVLLVVALRYVAQDRLTGSEALVAGNTGIKEWYFAASIPFALGLMFVHFVIRAVLGHRTEQPLSGASEGSEE